MSMQTPLGRVRGLGSAKNGTHHWWMQRVTAVALVPLTVWFIYSILSMLGGGYVEAARWLASPINAVLMVLLIIATFHHLQLGLQVVIEDYIHGEGVKIAAIVIVKLASFALAVTGAFAVLKVAF